MIRNIHRSQRIDPKYDFYKKQYFYRVKRNYHQVFISRYTTHTGDFIYQIQPQKTLTPLRIGNIETKFKFNCKLCEFYTNQELLYERHLSSNNHFIRKNQF